MDQEAVMEDISDTSFSSYESVITNNSPTKTKFVSSRLSTSSNSHPSRSESNTSSSPSSSLTKSSFSHSSPCTRSSIQPEDGDRLERLLGIKQKYPCELCGKKIINMENHMKRMHGEGRPGEVVPCGQCDLIILRSDLGRHVLENHMQSMLDSSVSPPPVSSLDLEDFSNFLRTPTHSTETDGSAMVSLSISSITSTNPTVVSVETIKSDLMFLDSDSDNEMEIVPPVILKQIKVEPSLSIHLSSDMNVDLNQNSDQIPRVKEEFSDEKVKVKRGEVKSYKIDRSSKTVHFWIKTLNRDSDGEKIKTVKMMLASDKTISRVKRSYRDKLGLAMDKLHLVLEGRELDDSELVGQYHTKTILAEGLEDL